MKSATLLTFGAITIASILGYVSHKKKQLETLLDHLEFGVSRISNFSLSFKRIAVKLHLHALNPTETSFEINTGFVKLKTLRVYHKKTNTLLAHTHLDTNTIIIPSKSFYFFTPIHVKLPLATAGELLVQQLVKKEKIQQEFTEHLTFELEVTILGKKQLIQF